MAGVTTVKMAKKSDNSRYSLKEILPYAVLILLGVALFIRSAYGFCQSDESFYVSTAGRFASGDVIFADEWHPTQMSSLLTAPVYAMYRLVTGGTAGMIRFFRCVYLLLTMAEAAWIYTRMKGMGRRYAGSALALFILLYCHLNMATLSYYMICFQCFLMAALMCYRAEKSVYFGAGGFFYALAVLSLPSLAVASTLVFVILALCCIRKKEIRRPFLCFLAGICIPLVLFLIYVYASGLGIAGILANLVNILSDSEHDRDYYQSFKAFFHAIEDAYGRIYYLSLLLVAVSILSCFREKLRRSAEIYILIADVMLFIYYAAVSARHTGFMNTAFALFVFPLFFLARKKDWYIFASLFLGGLAVSATYSFSSYSDLYVLSIGHGLAAAGGILLLSDYATGVSGRDVLTEDAGTESLTGAAETGILTEGAETGSLPGSEIIRKYICIAAVTVLILVSFCLRFAYVYRDAPVAALDTKLTEGPAAGLITTAEHAGQYEGVLEAIEKYDEAQGCILFTRILPWGYTASKMRVGAPDTWRNEISSERLVQYYDLKPDREPDVVVVLDAEAGSYETGGDVEADPAPNANTMEGELGRRLMTGYTGHREACCTVYTRNR